MSATPDPKVFDIQMDDGPETEMEKIDSVGTYAISIRWQDGHEFGIFTWAYLRALCPCNECRSISF